MTATERAIKIRKVRALVDHGATEGERQAAREALYRLQSSKPVQDDASRRIDQIEFRLDSIIESFFASGHGMPSATVKPKNPKRRRKNPAWKFF